MGYQDGERKQQRIIQHSLGLVTVINIQHNDENKILSVQE